MHCVQMITCTPTRGISDRLHGDRLQKLLFITDGLEKAENADTNERCHCGRIHLSYTVSFR